MEARVLSNNECCKKCRKPPVLSFGDTNYTCSDCLKSLPLVKKQPKPPTILKDTPPKKRSVPLALKRKVWAKHIGEDIGKAKCTCCKLSDISQMGFHCGHIVAHENGGKNTLLNLKPICQSCNSSMGPKNMDQFIKECGL